MDALGERLGPTPLRVPDAASPGLRQIVGAKSPQEAIAELVQTLGGRELVSEAYRQAIREEYRFYSYGDAMLIA